MLCLCLSDKDYLNHHRLYQVHINSINASLTCHKPLAVVYSHRSYLATTRSDSTLSSIRTHLLHELNIAKDVEWLFVLTFSLRTQYFTISPNQPFVNNVCVFKEYYLRNICFLNFVCRIGMAYVKQADLNPLIFLLLW